MDPLIYQIESEPEFLRITSALEEARIPYTFKKNTDPIFPVLGQYSAYAQITVEGEYFAEFQNIIKDVLNVELKTSVQGDPPPPRKKIDKWKLILVIYSLITSIFVLKYWYSNQGISEDKNFKNEWNWDNTQLFVKYKKTGMKANVYIDENYDLNFEKTISYRNDGSILLESFDRNENGYYESSKSYSNFGIHIAEWWDLNEDGYFEETYNFNLKNLPTIRQFDLNNDGMVEAMEIVLDNFDTLRLTDKNVNGFFEIEK